MRYRNRSKRAGWRQLVRSVDLYTRKLKEEQSIMWYFILVAASAAFYFASRRWGRAVYYHRWGRWLPFRRALLSKSRPPTPPIGIGGTNGGDSDGESANLLPMVKDDYDDGKLHTVRGRKGAGGRMFTFFWWKC